MAVTLSKQESLNRVNLRKEEVHKVCLSKGGMMGNLVSRVGVMVDFSGSMGMLYRDGTVQEVLEKIFPIALNFDDNGEMEFWLFESKAYRLPSVTIDNYYGYIDRETANYRMGGTNYAPSLKDAYSKYMIEDPAKLPNYIIFITDGENSDTGETNNVMRQISNYPIFIQFVGIGNSSFHYLESLDNMSGRYVDNANFFQIKDIANENDKTLYEKLLAEYPQWLQSPQVQQMINAQCEPGQVNQDIFDNGAGSNTENGASGASGNGRRGFFGKMFGH